jgi:cell division protease FtsH
MAIEKRTQISLWYFLGAFMLLLMLNVMFSHTPVRSIDYSQFRALLRSGQIEECTISSQHITGTRTGGTAKAPAVRFITIRAADPELLTLLKTSKTVNFRARVEDKWLTEMIAWIVGIAIFFGVWMFLMKRMGAGGSGMMNIGKSKAKIYVETETKVTFADVAGIDEAEDEVREVVEFLKTPDRFKRLGGRIPKGVLLVGPPGTGKTLLARAVAGESGVPFFSMSGSDFVEMFVGVGAARVRDLFQQAKGRAPCIVFIDELDAMGKARGMNPLGGHDEREQTLNQLLVEMDGFEANTGVIIMAATNRPETLDNALLRPGRFDRQIVVDKPDINGRRKILDIHARTVELGEDVDLHALAAGTPGMVGADLSNIINEAALLAARKDHDSITMNDLQEAVERTMIGLQKKNRVLSKKERLTIAYHEAGHALTRLCCPNAHPVHRVTIIPRGVAALGYTMHLPKEDRYLNTRSELEDELVVTLGGRAAEEIIFKQISTGASNDFQQATNIASNMVKNFGMSEMGIVSYQGDDQSQFMRRMMGGSPQYSEKTAGEIDKEVRRIITRAYDRAVEILTEQEETLRVLADTLLEKETMLADELNELVAGREKPVEAFEHAEPQEDADNSPAPD